MKSIFIFSWVKTKLHSTMNKMSEDPPLFNGEWFSSIIFIFPLIQTPERLQTPDRIVTPGLNYLQK